MSKEIYNYNSIAAKVGQIWTMRSLETVIPNEASLQYN